MNAEDALRRELLEEIGWCPRQLNPWLQHRIRTCGSPVPGDLAVPLNQLQLLEGQDMDLVSLDEIRRGWIGASVFKPNVHWHQSCINSSQNCTSWIRRLKEQNHQQSDQTQQDPEQRPDSPRELV